MQCPNCHTELHGESKCPGCGATISYPAEQPLSKSEKFVDGCFLGCGGIGCLLPAIIVFIFLIGGIIYAIFHG